MDFGEKALPKEFLEDYYRDIGEFLDKCKKTDSAFRVIGFFETNDLIAFGLMYKYGVIHVYYSKTTEKTMVVNELENDMFLSGLKNKSTYLNLPKAVNKSNLYTIINAYNFIEEVDKLKTKMTSSEWELFIKQNKKIDSIYKNIDIQDNPIIMIGKIK